MDRQVESANTDAANTPATGRPTDTRHDVDGATRDGGGRPTPEYRGTGIMWSGVAVVVLVALMLVVALQNTQDVRFEFLWLEASMPLILILAITFGAALVLGETVGFVWRRRQRKRRRDREELRRLRRER